MKKKTEISQNLKADLSSSKLLVDDGYPWIEEYFTLLKSVKEKLCPDTPSALLTRQLSSSAKAGGKIFALQGRLFPNGLPMIGAAGPASSGPRAATVSSDSSSSEKLSHPTKDRPKVAGKRVPTRRR